MFVKALRPIAMTAAGISLCLATAPAAANPCVAGVQGCVLPLSDAPPASMPSEAPPGDVVAPRGGGLGWLLPVLGVAAAILAALLLLDDDDEDRVTP
jgi:hypothetical protein